MANAYLVKYIKAKQLEDLAVNKRAAIEKYIEQINAQVDKINGIDYKYSAENVLGYEGKMFIPNGWRKDWGRERESALAQYESMIKTFESMKVDYDSSVDKYSAAIIEQNEYRYLSFTSKEIDLPNAKDENQWLAGGYLANDKAAGGNLFNPTEVLSFDEKPRNDESYHIAMGSVLSFLNSGFTEIYNDVRAYEFLDLFAEDEVTIKRFEVKVTVSNQNGDKERTTIIVETGSSGGKNQDNFNYGEYTNYTEMSTQEIADAYKSIGINLMSPDVVGTVISYTITNMVTGDFFKSPKMSIRNFVISSLVTTTKSMVANLTTSSIAKALGITSFNAMAALNVVVGLTISELAEMALGLDNSFGFGGEYNEEASMALGVAGFEEAHGFMGIGTLVDKVSFSLGIANSYSANITSFNGSLVGYQGQFDDGTTEFTENFNLATGDTTYTGGTMVDGMVDNFSNIAKQADLDAKAMMAQLDNFSNTGFANMTVTEPSSGGVSGGGHTNLGGFGYGGGGGGSSGGGNNNSGGGGGTWVCTAAKEESIIDENKYKVMKKYGIELRRKDPYMMKGYDIVGKLYAKGVHRTSIGKKIALFLSDFFEAKYKNKKLTKGQKVFNFFTTFLLRPLYRLIGFIDEKIKNYKKT